ncbi:hypothetical protein [Weissella confusa]|uniref:hypothetical protein n=1 Tax=Weissella confusa TaxID=1583 RepID=UPI00107F5A4C|nr:hypothetical protein [Weissella confusa]TGE56209.1 hypothetical protein C6P20_03545 [Weissella confusa]
MKNRQGSLLAQTLMLLLLCLSGFTFWVAGQSRQQQARHLVIANWTKRQEALRFLMATRKHLLCHKTQPTIQRSLKEMSSKKWYLLPKIIAL